MSEINPGHGNIRVSCEVACDVCGSWMLGLKYPKSEAIRELRANGWGQIKRLWVCPVCIAERKPNTP